MKKIYLSIIACMYLSGCNSSAIFEAGKSIDEFAVKNIEFDKNVTGFITGKNYQLHKEKDKHINVKVE
jgi:predicted small secreted protein